MTDALRDAFGFEAEPTQFPVREVPPEFAYGTYREPPPYRVGIVSERNLHMDKITAKLRTDIPGFLKRYFDFPDDEYPEKNDTVPHVVNLLEEMFIGGSIVAQFATDHVKSVGSSEFFPVLSLAENPDESHIICGANFNDSKRRIQVVQRHFEGNHDLLRDFPWLKKPERPKRGGSGGVSWSRVELTVSGRSSNRPDPSIYAAAIGSNDIRGRRGKLIVDDAEGEEHRHLSSKRVALYDFVKLEGQRCFEDLHESKRPLQIALGTPFDVDSIYFKLERDGWRVIKVPAYAVPWEKIQRSSYMKGTTTATPWKDRAALLPDRYFTWPRKRFKITEQDPNFGKKMTKAQFSIAYLLDPAAGDPTRLSIEQMERLMREVEFPQAGDWKTLVSMDPASGSRSRSADYCGITVVKIRWPRGEKHPDVQVLEAHKVEQGIVEQVEMAADLAVKHQCDVIYETNSQQGQNYRDIFSLRRPEVRLVPYYTTHADKYDEHQGLTIVRTLIKSRRLLAPAGQIQTEGMQAFLREIRDLGSENVHDHLSCSVWFVVSWVFKQVRYAPTLVPVVARSFGGVGTSNWRTWNR